MEGINGLLTRVELTGEKAEADEGDDCGVLTDSVDTHVNGD